MFNKAILRSICIFLVLFMLSAKSFCQSSSHYFKNYQVYNGLSSNTITTILQDKKGFMWFGTRNGLNRFDGNVFKIYQSKLSDTLSIGSNSIFSLYEGAKEQLWVGTYKGIYLYNPSKESFTPFKLIPPGEVRYIKGDSQHNIWIVSDLNLYKYNELTSKITSYKLTNDQTIVIQLSEKGVLWSATSKGIIKRYNPSTDNFIDYDVTLYNGGKKISAIQDIRPIADTSLLIGTMNQALLFNYKTKKTGNLFNGKKDIPDIHTHVIFQDNDGSYWLGTEAGLYIFNIQTGMMSLVQKQYSNPYSITDNIISSIYKDAEGGIWIGSYFGGINYYSKQFNNFKKYFPEPGINSLSGNIVHEICKDQFGHLWVGTEDAGLNQVDLKSGYVKHFLPGKEKGSITYRNIHGLVADGNELWIGTYEHGLDVMDLTTQKVIRHYNVNKNSASFTSDFIVALYKTRNGDILVGTWNGLFKYNRTTDNFTALPFFNAHIQSIHEDEYGTLWVSSYGSGVYYWNALNGKKGHLTYQAGKTSGLINNYVNGLFEDSKRNLWCCTEGGLSQYNTQTGAITNYTVENGLPANQVFRMLEDDKGTLWISTSKGLASFDPKHKQFNNYHTANGLPTEQFNYNSAFKDTDGTMYFGTVKGMVSFRPTKFALSKFIPPVYITGIQVNNQDVPIGNNKSILNQSITNTSTITLPYDQSNISLDVAALSYIIPEMNDYSYKMDGIDKNWTQLKNNRKIYYTKLPPGEYLFRVKGANSEGVWNNHETKLSIKVLPPYWATVWAYLFYTAIVVTVILIIFRYYHIAVKEKNKRRIEAIEINTEREIYNAKIEFFTNIAHEIRTPLTLIKMPLDKLINKDNSDAETTESLNMMKKNTNRLIDLTNQLLDFRKAEANKFSLNFSKTDINELLNEVYSIFKSSAEQKNLFFKLELPRITLQAYVDSEALKKILSNLFNNAIKYADKNVSIKLLPFSSEDQLFNIEIRNDGFIIPAVYKDKIFEPFFRIKETEKEAGTGIGLPLSRSLAQLHKGVLELKTATEGANIFLLSLPIHQEKEIHFGENDQDEIMSKTTDDIDADYSDHSKPAILIVEDNKEILNYIKKELIAQYHVLKAYNGQEALEILQTENIQLVISDIMMPVMDGIQLCKRMKSDIQYSHVPVILLTAKNSLNSKIEGLEVGADAYIEKPFAFEHLVAQMNNLLTNRNMMKEYFARSPLTHIKGIAVSKADKDFLERLNKVIYDNITDIDLDVEQLSGMMNMSRPTLYRKIKGISDLSPNELINLTRLKKGAELLAEGDYKINEVANMIGYSLPTNFSRDFQRQFGVSPSSYLSTCRSNLT
jgi:ligand-binding sensor domain-containing protein/signal transduction histidine kinase/DNA-binding response OmpR family regulator